MMDFCENAIKRYSCSFCGADISNGRSHTCGRNETMDITISQHDFETKYVSRAAYDELRAENAALKLKIERTENILIARGLGMLIQWINQPVEPYP